MKKQRGFTLVEVLITIIIMAIFLTIAIPSYQRYVQRARRADAWHALSQDQTILERCYAQGFSYSGCSSLPSFPHNSTQGYYNIALSNLSATTYTLTATAIGSQAKDTDCATISVNQANQKTGTTTTCWNN